VGLRDVQQVIVLPQVFGVIGKLFAAIVGLAELVRLDHRAHGAIDDDDAFLQ